jgi:hypothetical protein
VSEYIPTTGQVRDVWEGVDNDDPELRAEFDRWHEAEKRKWQAEALRAAADADEERADYLIDTMPDAFSGLTKERLRKRDEAFELRRSANRLRDAADRIEKGVQDDH